MVDVPDFDALYRGNPDPWEVGSSHYEQRKLAVLLASLTRAGYRLAWDPACGTGELAARLADRAGLVLATDSSVEAVRLTTARCADMPTVTVAPLRQPAAPSEVDGPPGTADPPDLVLITEFAYYLDVDDRTALWPLVDAVCAPTAEVVVLHWRHHPHDGHLSGADVDREATESLSAAGWRRVVHHDDEDFVLSVLRRDRS